jgi:hypothetical protein
MRRWIALALLTLSLTGSPAWAGNTHGSPDPTKESQATWGDALGPYIHSGCLPTVPSSSLTFGAFACTGYVRGSSNELVYVSQASTAVGALSGGNGTYWIALHRDTSSSISGWTRQSATHYAWKLASTRPADPSGGLVVSKVTVAGGAITAVTDYRPPASYARRGVYALDDPLYGGACDGTSADNGTGTDNVAAWALAVGGMKDKGGVLWVPTGFCYFASQPAPLQNGIMVTGEGMDNTYLIRGYTEADASQGFLDMDLANTGDVDNAGGGVRDLTLWAKTGTTGGSAIDMVSSATAGQGRITIDTIRISASGQWNYGVRADGSLNATASPGIRIITVRHTYVFVCNVAGIIAIGFNHLNLDQIGIYSRTGGVDLIVDGGTGGTVQSNNAHISCEFCTLVNIGETQATVGVYFTTSHTTTLVTSAALGNFTFSGSLATHTGVYSTASPNNISFFGGGKGGFGIPSFTSAGAQLESADGLTFPATQIVSANANTLDDYEENVWTPVIEGTSTAGAGTYSVQIGTYTKIGDRALVDLQLVWSAHTGTGNMNVTGLPFAAKTATGYLAACAVVQSNLNHGAGTQLTAYILSGASTISLRASDPGGTAIAAIALDTAATLGVQCTYRTN